MMKIIYRGKLKHIEFTLALGDLFTADVKSIVNSEQTDFVLSSNPNSLSGQIRHRYGKHVQRELDDATEGQVLHPGTILDTTGGTDFDRIFHAGFHDPGDWPDTPGGSRDADYFDAIGSCIRQILDAVIQKELTSVAFPLIGCGVFGLDEKMLVRQFISVVENLDDRLERDEKLNVWLVIRDSAQFEAVAGVFVASLLQARSEMTVVQLDRSGVAILDRFAARFAQRSNEYWAKWQLCQYAEIALKIMCYGLCRAVNPSPTPEELFGEGVPSTFGLVRKHALDYATKLSSNISGWGASFFADVLTTKEARRALETINAQRNNLAHGRETLSLTKIRELVVQGLQLDAWPTIRKAEGELQFDNWSPWVSASSAATSQIGLFERWQKNSFRYLVPETGEVFTVPHKSVT